MIWGLLLYENIFIVYSFLQGNYDSFVQTRSELEENQMKKYKWEQDQIAHMKVKHQLQCSQHLNRHCTTF